MLFFLIFFGYLWNNYGHPNGVKGRKRNGEWNNARDRELVFAHSSLILLTVLFMEVYHCILLENHFEEEIIVVGFKTMIHVFYHYI